MARWGDCDFKQLKDLQDKINKFQAKESFYEACAKELAAKLLARVIKRTPVGDYSKDNVIKTYKSGSQKGETMYTKTGKVRREKFKLVNFTTKKDQSVSFHADTSGKKGGTLRRGWTAKSEAEAMSGGSSNAKAYADSLPVRKSGDIYEIEVINPVNYASYVEYGHRTRNHEGWVEGKFMLTISEQELNSQAPQILERKLQKYLEDMFNGK